MAPRPGPLLATLLILAVPLAGCTDYGTTVETRGEGHLLAGGVTGASALRLDGLAHPVAVDGPVAGRFGPGNHSSEPAALVFHEATLKTGEKGLLFVLSRTFTLEGRLEGHASEALLTAARTTLGMVPDTWNDPHGYVPEHVYQGQWFGTMARAAPFGLTATGPLRITADRFLLATDAGFVNLTGPVTVETSLGLQANAAVLLDQPAATTTLEVVSGRATLAMSGAKGDVRIDGGNPATLNGDTLIPLARGSRVQVTPSASGVRSTLDGHAYQVITGGKPLLRARVAVEFDPDVATVADGVGDRAELRIRNLDPNTDAVLTRISLTGAPQGAVGLPRVSPLSLTDTVLSDPLTGAVMAPAAPALFFADVLLAFAWLFEPPAIPQQIEAGAVFETAAGLQGQPRPYDAVLRLEGNFDAVETTLHVRPAA